MVGPGRAARLEVIGWSHELGGLAAHPLEDVGGQAKVLAVAASSANDGSAGHLKISDPQIAQ